MCNKIEEICCICLYKIKKNGKVIFHCSHKIHLNCFMELLKHDTIFCPLCKKRIEANIDFYNFINFKFLKIIKNLKKIEKKPEII